MSKNICLILTNMKSGGLQRNASILANHFVQNGNNVYICCLYSTECFFELNSKIQLLDCKSNKSKYRSISFWKKKLHSFFLDKKIDTVVSFGERCGIVASKAIKGLNLNHICRGVNTKKNCLNKIMLNNSLKNITHFVFQTNAQKNIYNKNIQNKGVVISNPFEVQTSNLNVGGVSSNRFVTVASFKLKQKRQDLMVEALSMFSKEYPNYVFEFYGECDKEAQQRILDLAKQHDVEDKIKLMGESKNIKNAIIPSKAFICASTYEGMPNALIEAMSYGIPVITSNWNGVDEIIKDKENGLLFEINNSRELSDLMKQIAEDEKMFNRISDESWKSCASKFNKADVLNKWDELI